MDQSALCLQATLVCVAFQKCLAVVCVAFQKCQTILKGHTHKPEALLLTQEALSNFNPPEAIHPPDEPPLSSHTRDVTVTWTSGKGMFSKVQSSVRVLILTLLYSQTIHHFQPLSTPAWLKLVRRVRPW